MRRARKSSSGTLLNIKDAHRTHGTHCLVSRRLGSRDPDEGPGAILVGTEDGATARRASEAQDRSGTQDGLRAGRLGSSYGSLIEADAGT